MPLTTASAVTLTFAMGYPLGALAVSEMTPMAVLVLRFTFAAVILATWAALSHVGWPRGRKLGHVAAVGILMQAGQFLPLYVAMQMGAPAVLCAVLIAMNPVVTALLGAAFLREGLGVRRILALALGVIAAFAACATRLIGEGGVDPAVLLILVALLGLAAGGVYQQRFCADVDFRASSAVQNAVAILPAVGLALATPFAVHDPVKAAIAVACVVLFNATVALSLYVRAINLHGAAAVSMLFCVIPAVAGVMGWVLLGQRIDAGVGVGLVVGALACWLNARGDKRSGGDGGRERSDARSGRDGGQERSDLGSSKERQDDPGRDGRRQDRVETVHQTPMTG